MIEISQRANVITGLSTHAISESSTQISADIIRNYKLTGVLKDRFLMITGISTDSSRIGAITILAEVIGDGQTMTGIGVGYSSSNSKIESVVFTGKRARPKSA